MNYTIQYEVTKTASWRVRLSELIPRECLPKYLGLFGSGADPGLLPASADGKTSSEADRLPTSVAPFETLHFQSPLPETAYFPEWEVPSYKPPMTSVRSDEINNEIATVARVENDIVDYDEDQVMTMNDLQSIVGEDIFLSAKVRFSMTL